MEFNLAKKIIRKSKSLLGISSRPEITIMTTKWMKEQSEKYLDETKRDLSLSVTTNGKERVAYPNVTRAIERAIDELLNSREYSFKNMLVIKNPYQYSPLCAMAVFETKNPCDVEVTVHGKTSDCDIKYILPKEVKHKVPIMGLYAGYANVVDIKLIDERGRGKVKTFKLPMANLKGRNSEIKVTKDLSKTEFLYGLTLVYGGDDGIYPYAFDKNGDVRFAFAMSPKTYGFQPISKGRFLFLNKSVTRLTCTNTASTQMFEVDQMGRFHKIYNIEKGAHHDFAEIENGNLVMGANAVEGKTYEDTIIEIDRKTGDVVNEIRIKDYIDPQYVDSPDWAHLNALEYNTVEKTVMVCLRNLHSVMKIDYGKKELMWILGHPKFWEGSTVKDKVLIPQGDDMAWFFQSHAAYTIKENLDGNSDTKQIIVYDNHIQKRIPVSYFDDDESSFVRIYTINEKEHRVSLHKSYGFEKSKIRSNGVFEGKAGRVMAMNGKLADKQGERRGSIIEFDYETGNVLNKFSMNYGFYRAYEFKFMPDEMVKNIEPSETYSLGKIYELETAQSLDVSDAQELPEPVLEDIDKTEEDRRNRLNKICKKNPDFYVDPEQDMARIIMTLEEDVLYAHLLDHQLERLYFVGDNHIYFRDYTDTTQERPEYFVRANNVDALPLKDMATDHYTIYYKHKVGLYKSDYFVKISQERKN